MTEWRECKLKELADFNPTSLTAKNNLKFINYLESITGIGIYPLTSLLIFFLFFMVVGLYAFKMDKTYIAKLKQIPFEL